MAENDFTVNFGQDDFQVVFGEQGPQGPSAAAVPFDIAEVFEIGDIVYDTTGNLFGSKVDSNVGNPLTDTDAWTPLGIADGTVTQLNDLTDVTLNTPLTNQGLIFDGTNWVNKAIPNNIPVNPAQEKTTLTLEPTEITFGDPDANTARGTVSINDGFSIDGVDFDVRDQNNHPIVPTSVVGNIVNFNVDNDIRGHISVSATVAYTQDSDNTTGSDTITRTIPVREQWGTSLSSDPPGLISNVNLLGVWNSPQSRTESTVAGVDRNLYVVLPTDRAPYRFTSGIAILDQTTIGVISSIYTVYQLTDFSDDGPSGQQFIFTVTEV